MFDLTEIRIPLAAYVAAVVAAVAATAASDSAAVAIAAAAVVAATLTWVEIAWVRRERARGGVERHIASESASLAFYTVVLALGTYSLFEAMAGAPRPSVYAIFVFATLVWTAWWIAVRRRVA